MSDADWKNAVSDANKAYRTARKVRSLVRKGKRTATKLKKNKEESE